MVCALARSRCFPPLPPPLLLPVVSLVLTGELLIKFDEAKLLVVVVVADCCELFSNDQVAACKRIIVAWGIEPAVWAAGITDLLTPHKLAAVGRPLRETTIHSRFQLPFSSHRPYLSFSAIL